MKKTLIIVRHGNTFLPEQTPTRVGRGTDLPLVEEKRGRAVGKYLLSQNIILDAAYAAPLKRTMQTAQLILDEMHSPLTIIPEQQFSEIDYGPDENKTEDEVMLRLGEDHAVKLNLVNISVDDKLKYGKSIIQKWDSDGTIPAGWSVNIDFIIQNWKDFSVSIPNSRTVLLCSSNGIIRFAPYILDMPYNQFCKTYDIKVATGSVSIFDFEDERWTCREWNTKAYNLS